MIPLNFSSCPGLDWKASLILTCGTARSRGLDPGYNAALVLLLGLGVGIKEMLFILYFTNPLNENIIQN